MRVVSNTSPVSNLAIIGRLELLERRYGQVRIPREVATELSGLSHPAGRAQIQAALELGWLVVETQLALPSLTLPFPLDAGEQAAIALAVATTADVLLIDEKRGRTAARGLGLVVAGLLGELLHARQRGCLPNLRREIERLRKEAGFFVDAEIEDFILSQVGE
jgi:predicted nucleic acid-binding protein